MPIRAFLTGHPFSAQAINTMSLAFDSACNELGLVKTTEDPTTKAVAEKVIEIATRGVMHPDRLRELALKELRN